MLPGIKNKIINSENKFQEKSRLHINQILLNAEIRDIDSNKIVLFHNLIPGKKYIFTGEYEKEQRFEIAKYISEFTLELTGNKRYYFIPKELGHTFRDILRIPRLEYVKIEKTVKYIF